ncbi:MAG: hypothetical protein ACT4NX_00120 [Deltaproteobacteria bacterium]
MRRNKIIAVVQDIMFISKIREAAKPLDVDLEFIKSASALADKLKSAGAAAVVIDLNLRGESPIEAVRAVKSSDELRSIPIIGYLSHVQTDLREEALAAGCDLALPKSKFSRDLAEILAKYA